jgi:hypothetical protein
MAMSDILNKNHVTKGCLGLLIATRAHAVMTRLFTRSLNINISVPKGEKVFAQ